jgi:hypothetical protein
MDVAESSGVIEQLATHSSPLALAHDATSTRAGTMLLPNRVHIDPVGCIKSIPLQINRFRDVTRFARPTGSASCVRDVGLAGRDCRCAGTADRALWFATGLGERHEP